MDFEGNSDALDNVFVCILESLLRSSQIVPLSRFVVCTVGLRHN